MSSENNPQLLEIPADSGPTEIRALRETLMGNIESGVLPQSVEITGEEGAASASALQFLISLSRTQALSSLAFGPKATALRAAVVTP